MVFLPVRDIENLLNFGNAFTVEPCTTTWWGSILPAAEVVVSTVNCRFSPRLLTDLSLFLAIASVIHIFPFDNVNMMPVWSPLMTRSCGIVCMSTKYARRRTINH